MEAKRWISVKDRLPKETVNVLVWVENRENLIWSNYAIGMNENNNWYLINGRQSHEVVTHWTELPKPLKTPK